MPKKYAEKQMQTQMQKTCSSKGRSQCRNKCRKNAGNIKVLVTDMIDIQKEIYFGKTSLPLYKVYSLEDEKSKPYKYLKSASDFSKDKKDQIGAKDNDFAYPISAFSMSSQKNVYSNFVH